jgi:hypothetical protein
MRASLLTALRWACLALILSSAAHAQAPGERARALEGRIIDRFSGQGLQGLTVRLYDAAGTLMDLTHTDEAGKYRLDLGVLNPDEHQAISTFHIEVREDADHAVTGALSEGTSRDGPVIRYRVMSLP